MVITFFGHSSFSATKELEDKLISLLEATAGDGEAEMYLGGYGGFDDFVYACCKKYKATHPSVSLVFVTPYITLEYQKNHLAHKSKLYDCVVYPEIEDKPLRFAITYRNRYMAERADVVITYINHSHGGAYKSYKHAMKMKKNIINLGKLQEKYDKRTQ